MEITRYLILNVNNHGNKNVKVKDPQVDTGKPSPQQEFPPPREITGDYGQDYPPSYNNFPTAPNPEDAENYMSTERVGGLNNGVMQSRKAIQQRLFPTANTPDADEERKKVHVKEPQRSDQNGTDPLRYWSRPRQQPAKWWHRWDENTEGHLTKRPGIISPIENPFRTFNMSRNAGKDCRCSSLPDVNHEENSEEVTAVTSTVVRSIQFSLKGKKGPKTKRFNLDMKAMQDITKLLTGNTQNCNDIDTALEQDTFISSCKSPCTKPKRCVSNDEFNTMSNKLECLEKMASISCGRNLHNLMQRHFEESLSKSCKDEISCSSESSKGVNICQSQDDSTDVICCRNPDENDKGKQSTTSCINIDPLNEGIMLKQDQSICKSFPVDHYPATSIQGSLSFDDYQNQNHNDITNSEIFPKTTLNLCEKTKKGSKKLVKLSKKQEPCSICFNAHGIYLEACFPGADSFCRDKETNDSDGRTQCHATCLNQCIAQHHSDASRDVSRSCHSGRLSGSCQAESSGETYSRQCCCRCQPQTFRGPDPHPSGIPRQSPCSQCVERAVQCEQPPTSSAWDQAIQCTPTDHRAQYTCTENQQQSQCCQAKAQQLDAKCCTRDLNCQDDSTTFQSENPCRLQSTCCSRQPFHQPCETTHNSCDPECPNHYGCSSGHEAPGYMCCRKEYICSSGQYENPCRLCAQESICAAECSRREYTCSTGQCEALVPRYSTQRLPHQMTDQDKSCSMGTLRKDCKTPENVCSGDEFTTCKPISNYNQAENYKNGTCNKDHICLGRSEDICQRPAATENANRISGKPKKDCWHAENSSKQCSPTYKNKLNNPCSAFKQSADQCCTDTFNREIYISKMEKDRCKQEASGIQPNLADDALDKNRTADRLKFKSCFDSEPAFAERPEGACDFDEKPDKRNDINNYNCYLSPCCVTPKRDYSRESNPDLQQCPIDDDTNQMETNSDADLRDPCPYSGYCTRSKERQKCKDLRELQSPQYPDADIQGKKKSSTGEKACFPSDNICTEWCNSPCVKYTHSSMSCSSASDRSASLSCNTSQKRKKNDKTKTLKRKRKKVTEQMSPPRSEIPHCTPYRTGEISLSDAEGDNHSTVCTRGKRKRTVTNKSSRLPKEEIQKPGIANDDISKLDSAHITSPNKPVPKRRTKKNLFGTVNSSLLLPESVDAHKVKTELDNRTMQWTKSHDISSQVFVSEMVSRAKKMESLQFFENIKGESRGDKEDYDGSYALNSRGLGSLSYPLHDTDLVEQDSQKPQRATGQKVMLKVVENNDVGNTRSLTRDKKSWELKSQSYHNISGDSSDYYGKYRRISRRREGNTEMNLEDTDGIKKNNATKIFHGKKGAEELLKSMGEALNDTARDSCTPDIFLSQFCKKDISTDTPSQRAQLSLKTEMFPEYERKEPAVNSSVFKENSNFPIRDDEHSPDAVNSMKPSDNPAYHQSYTKVITNRNIGTDECEQLQLVSDAKYEPISNNRDREERILMSFGNNSSSESADARTYTVNYPIKIKSEITANEIDHFFSFIPFNSSKTLLSSPIKPRHKRRGNSKNHTTCDTTFVIEPFRVNLKNSRCIVSTDFAVRNSKRKPKEKFSLVGKNVCHYGNRSFYSKPNVRNALIVNKSRKHDTQSYYNKSTKTGLRKLKSTKLNSRLHIDDQIETKRSPKILGDPQSPVMHCTSAPLKHHKSSDIGTSQLGQSVCENTLWSVPVLPGASRQHENGRYTANKTLTEQETGFDLHEIDGLSQLKDLACVSKLKNMFLASINGTLLREKTPCFSTPQKEKTPSLQYDTGPPVCNQVENEIIIKSNGNVESDVTIKTNKIATGANNGHNESDKKDIKVETNWRCEDGEGMSSKPPISYDIDIYGDVGLNVIMATGQPKKLGGSNVVTSCPNNMKLKEHKVLTSSAFLSSYVDLEQDSEKISDQKKGRREETIIQRKPAAIESTEKKLAFLSERCRIRRNKSSDETNSDDNLRTIFGDDPVETFGSLPKWLKKNTLKTSIGVVSSNENDKRKPYGQCPYQKSRQKNMLHQNSQQKFTGNSDSHEHFLFNKPIVTGSSHGSQIHKSHYHEGRCRTPSCSEAGFIDKHDNLEGISSCIKPTRSTASCERIKGKHYQYSLGIRSSRSRSQTDAIQKSDNVDKTDGWIPTRQWSPSSIRMTPSKFEGSRAMQASSRINLEQSKRPDFPSDDDRPSKTSSKPKTSYSDQIMSAKSRLKRTRSPTSSGRDRSKDPAPVICRHSKSNKNDEMSHSGSEDTELDCYWTESDNEVAASPCVNCPSIHGSNEGSRNSEEEHGAHTVIKTLDTKLSSYQSEAVTLSEGKNSEIISGESDTFATECCTVVPDLNADPLPGLNKCKSSNKCPLTCRCPECIEIYGKKAAKQNLHQQNQPTLTDKPFDKIKKPSGDFSRDLLDRPVRKALWSIPSRSTENQNCYCTNNETNEARSNRECRAPAKSRRKSQNACNECSEQRYPYKAKPNTQSSAARVCDRSGSCGRSISPPRDGNGMRRITPHDQRFDNQTSSYRCTCAKKPMCGPSLDPGPLCESTAAVEKETAFDESQYSCGRCPDNCRNYMSTKFTKCQQQCEGGELEYTSCSGQHTTDGCDKCKQVKELSEYDPMKNCQQNTESDTCKIYPRCENCQAIKTEKTDMQDCQERLGETMCHCNKQQSNTQSDDERLLRMIELCTGILSVCMNTQGGRHFDSPNKKKRSRKRRKIRHEKENKHRKAPHREELEFTISRGKCSASEATRDNRVDHGVHSDSSEIYSSSPGSSTRNRTKRLAGSKQKKKPVFFSSPTQSSTSSVEKFRVKKKKKQTGKSGRHSAQSNSSTPDLGTSSGNTSVSPSSSQSSQVSAKSPTTAKTKKKLRRSRRHHKNSSCKAVQTLESLISEKKLLLQGTLHQQKGRLLELEKSINHDVDKLGCKVAVPSCQTCKELLVTENEQSHPTKCSCNVYSTSPHSGALRQSQAEGSLVICQKCRRPNQCARHSPTLPEVSSYFSRDIRSRSSPNRIVDLQNERSQAYCPFQMLIKQPQCISTSPLSCQKPSDTSPMHKQSANRVFNHGVKSCANQERVVYSRERLRHQSRTCYSNRIPCRHQTNVTYRPSISCRQCHDGSKRCCRLRGNRMHGVPASMISPPSRPISVVNKLPSLRDVPRVELPKYRYCDSLIQQLQATGCNNVRRIHWDWRNCLCYSDGQPVSSFVNKPSTPAYSNPQLAETNSYSKVPSERNLPSNLSLEKIDSSNLPPSLSPKSPSSTLGWKPSPWKVGYDIFRTDPPKQSSKDTENKPINTTCSEDKDTAGKKIRKKRKSPKCEAKIEEETLKQSRVELESGTCDRIGGTQSTEEICNVKQDTHAALCEDVISKQVENECNSNKMATMFKVGRCSPSEKNMENACMSKWYEHNYKEFEEYAWETKNYTKPEFEFHPVNLSDVINVKESPRSVDNVEKLENIELFTDSHHTQINDNCEQEGSLKNIVSKDIVHKEVSHGACSDNEGYYTETVVQNISRSRESIAVEEFSDWDEET